MNTVVTGGAAVLVWAWRRSLKTSLTDHDTERKLHDHETEITRLREWRHNVIVPWQQSLLGTIEDKFVTRREWDAARGDDSPWPNNRRVKPR